MIEQANLADAMAQPAGTQVTVKGVTVDGAFKADNADRMDYNLRDGSMAASKIDPAGHPVYDGGKVKFKVWRSRSHLQQGATVDITGLRKDWTNPQGMTYLSIETDGDGFLNVGVPVDTQPAQVPAPQAAPVQGATLVGHEVLWVELLDALKNPLEDDRARVAATAQWFIPLQQGKVTVEQIRNLIAILKDEVPF